MTYQLNISKDWVIDGGLGDSWEDSILMDALKVDYEENVENREIYKFRIFLDEDFNEVTLFIYQFEGVGRKEYYPERFAQMVENLGYTLEDYKFIRGVF